MGFASLWVLSLSLPLLPPKMSSFLVATETPDAFSEASLSSHSSLGSDRHALVSFLEALVQVSKVVQAVERPLPRLVDRMLSGSLRTSRC